MPPLRDRINPNTFVITLRQIAKHLRIDPKRIINWKKWHHVLWVHLEGKGGYFISYRKLEQWIAACRTLIRGCQNLTTLTTVWSAILKEATRYTENALSEAIPKGIARLQEIWQQRQTTLSNPQN
jgi:hypothetical protein